MQPLFKKGDRVRLVSIPEWWNPSRLGTIHTVETCSPARNPKSEKFLYGIIDSDGFLRHVFERRLAPLHSDIKIRLVRRENATQV